MNADQVRDYTVGTLTWWLSGYTPDHPQHHFQCADYAEDSADFIVTPMGPRGLEREQAKRFRVRLTVEEVKE